MKEITKICSMNGGLASWFQSSSPSNYFEELYENVLWSMKSCSAMLPPPRAQEPRSMQSLITFQ